MLTGCSGQQSALDPAGEEAAAVYDLFVAMVAGGFLVWLTVVGTLLYAARSKRNPWSDENASRLIGWGGVGFPIIVLFALLTYAVWLMPAIRPWLERHAAQSETIEVIGEQFWWRIRYPESGGVAAFETANELRLPVAKRTSFALKSADVIHSFWIPALGGKMDMIPGRPNTLSLAPTKAGIFRAPCAEFCGTSHTLMAFSVVVMEQEDYDAWRRRQVEGNGRQGSEGEMLFVRNGCSACHTIRGLTSAASPGPDLTAFGARRTVGAGALANSEDNIMRFIRDPASVKPGARMPAFGMLRETDVRAIARYLAGLE